MATNQLNALKNKGTHAVGNLLGIKVETLAHGAKVIGNPIDNFTLVELGFDAEGQRTVKQLAAKTNKAYLIASPEVRNMGESLCDFYNEIGELARIVLLKVGYTRFDTSAYTLNTGVTALAAGQVAHFDVATKKFIISAAGAAHTDYATSSAQFVVVLNEDDIDYLDGYPMVRLEVTKA